MSDAMMSVLRRIIAIVTASMLVGTLSAIAVVRADHKKGSEVAIGASQSGTGGDAISNGTTGDGSANSSAESSGAGSASGGSTNGSATGSTGGSASNGSTGSGSTGGAAQGATGTGVATGTTKGCTDANPSIGVFCDHFLVGGTTVLSGPLAVYGDQGLKSGLAWLAYFNSVLAPREGLRRVNLVWYDDSLDPQKTLSLVRRLHDVDKVLFISGVTSPEAVSSYLESTKFPLIGDIGLAPKSWTNRYIFPTAPSVQTRNKLRIKYGKQLVGFKTFAVIQDVLPSVDTTGDRVSWQKAAKLAGVQEKDYVEIASTANDCSAQFSRIVQSKPEYIILPTASAVMLSCLREARKFSVKPNGANSPWLKGWTGGSNLQLEVDNCKPYCEGMYSIGTPFNDPRTSQSPQMQTYRDNMAKYAPNVDITGFISINYYHAGWITYNLLKSSGIENKLTRENVLNAAEHFGPFETGFGNTVQWTTTIPREPSPCGYPVQVRGDKWVFATKQFCLTPAEQGA